MKIRQINYNYNKTYKEKKEDKIVMIGNEEYAHI